MAEQTKVVSSTEEVDGDEATEEEEGQEVAEATDDQDSQLKSDLDDAMEKVAELEDQLEQTQQNEYDLRAVVGSMLGEDIDIDSYLEDNIVITRSGVRAFRPPPTEPAKVPGRKTRQAAKQSAAKPGPNHSKETIAAMSDKEFGEFLFSS